MEIPEKGPLRALSTRDGSVETLLQSSLEPGRIRSEAAGKDTVSLTETGREFRTAVHHVHGLPEIREDRVMQIKRRLEEGSYRIEGHRIAVDMINETLENNHVLKHIDTKI